MDMMNRMSAWWVSRILLVLAVAHGDWMGASLGAAELVRVDRIWDQAHHNAFTDLARFQGHWFCVFREGTRHVSDDGALRVLRSKDGMKWESVALIESDIADLRDAKLSVTPDGKLLLSGAGALHDKSEGSHQSYNWFSDDGVTWGKAVAIGRISDWLWRTSWSPAGKAYSIGYRTGVPEERAVRLYESEDGRQYDVLVDNLMMDGYPNETSIVFSKDDTAYCLLRRDAGTKTGQWGVAKPPYTDWTWHDMGVRIGGPHMIRLPNGKFVAAVRLYDGKVRTSLCWIHPETGALDEFLALPSGGDTSYAGMVFHDGLLWVSYYSQHESLDPEVETDFTTAIYMAQVKLD
ncbi:MAG: exo-alpha-sialidase [Rhodopirellula sp. JB055]|uniref:exo-alpha-sialidase n=1 Tax=Rhodopirellula sp. JB055 TaxID=3342846 RepID=UPI00370C309F